MIVIDYHWLYFYISIFSIRDSTATWPVSSCVCLARKLWSNRCTTCRSLQPGRLSFAQHRCWSKSDQSMPSRSTLHALAEGICLRHSGPPAVSIAANHVLFSEGMCFMWCAHFNHHVPSCSIMFHHVPSCSIMFHHFNHHFNHHFPMINDLAQQWQALALQATRRELLLPWSCCRKSQPLLSTDVAYGCWMPCCWVMAVMVGWLVGWLVDVGNTINT